MVGVQTTTTTTENAKVEASLNLRLAESGAKNDINNKNNNDYLRRLSAAGPPEYPEAAAGVRSAPLSFP